MDALLLILISGMDASAMDVMRKGTDMKDSPDVYRSPKRRFLYLC